MVVVTDQSYILYYRTDTFTVTGSTGTNNPPTICGTNTGEHSKYTNIYLIC